MRNAALLCTGALLALMGCAGARYETITYPPRVDLSKLERIGVIEFSSPDQRELATIVTAKFMESARSEQGPIRMVTLRSEGRRPDAHRLRQLAEQHGLRTIVLGELRVSRVRPSVSVSESLSSASVSGDVEATLSVEMIEVESGASLWSASGRTRESVGGLSIQGVKSVRFDGAAPEAAYNGLVETLVTQVTRDMRATWERRRIS